MFNYLELNAAIAKSGKTKTDVAKELGVHLNTVSNWSTGKAAPTIDKLAAALRALGWSEERIAAKPFGDWYVNGSNRTEGT